MSSYGKIFDLFAGTSGLPRYIRNLFRQAACVPAEPEVRKLPDTFDAKGFSKRLTKHFTQAVQSSVKCIPEPQTPKDLTVTFPMDPEVYVSLCNYYRQPPVYAVNPETGERYLDVAGAHAKHLFKFLEFNSEYPGVLEEMANRKFNHPDFPPPRDSP